LLIDDRFAGTTCATVGCMPSKLLIAAANVAHNANRAHAFGLRATTPGVDGHEIRKPWRSSSAVQTSVEESRGQQSLQPPAARMEVRLSPEWPAPKQHQRRRNSASHPSGGSGFMKKPMASEMPAMRKARASRFLENLRVPSAMGTRRGSYRCRHAS
jgi:hypothetical protein